MTAWEILGIEKTTDVKAIRHAYAQLAKQCHPETEPEQFEQLYRVYQEALAFAKGKQQMPAVEHAQEKTAQKQNAKKEHTAERTEQNAQAGASIFDGFANRSEDMDDVSAEPDMQIPDYIKKISKQGGAAIAEGMKAFREVFEAKGRKDWKAFMTRPEFLRVQFDEGFAAELNSYLCEQTLYPRYKLPFHLVKELFFAYYPYMDEHGRGVLFEDDSFCALAGVLSSQECFERVQERHDAPNMVNEVVKYWAYYGIYSNIKKTGAVQDSKRWSMYLTEIAGREFYLKDGVKTPVDKHFYPMFAFLLKEGPTFSEELYGYLIKRFDLAGAKHSSRWQDVREICHAIEEKGIVIENEQKAEEKKRSELLFLMDEIKRLYCLEAESDRAEIRAFFRSEVYDRHKLDSALLDDKLLLFVCLDARLFSKVFAEEYTKVYDEIYANALTQTGKSVYNKMQYYRDTDLAIGEGFTEITKNRQEWVLKYFFEEGFTRVWSSRPKSGMPTVYRELLTKHFHALAEQRHYERDLYTDGHLYALRKEGFYLFVYDNMRYGQFGEKTTLTIQEYDKLLEKLMNFYLEHYSCTEATKAEWLKFKEKTGELCKSKAGLAEKLTSWLQKGKEV